MDVKKVLVGVAAVALVAGVSGGAYAAVTSDKRALSDEYDAYSKSYAQVEGTMKDLAPINDGCIVDMNDEKLNPLCEDLDAAIKAVPEKVTIDLDKANVDKARAEVAEAQKALDTASANVDKAYEVAELKLEAAREAFVAEVDKIIKETKTFIKDAQVIIDAAKEAKVDASELETAKVEAEKVVAELESDRDTMRRSTHTETVAELTMEKETVDVLASATLVVVADKDEKVAEKAVTTIGDTGRVSVEKAVEKVVEADQSGKLATITKNNGGSKNGSSITSTAVATPKAQTTTQTNTNTNSGKSTGKPATNGNTNGSGSSVGYTYHVNPGQSGTYNGGNVRMDRIKNDNPIEAGEEYSYQVTYDGQSLTGDDEWLCIGGSSGGGFCN